MILLMTFDKYLCNHHNQDMDSFPHTQKFSRAPLLINLFPPANQDNLQLVESHVCGIKQYVHFYVWLLSLRKMFFRFSHIVTCIESSLPFIDYWYSIIWMNHNLYIYSCADGHLDGLHISDTMNKAAMNPLVQVFMWAYVFISLD